MAKNYYDGAAPCEGCGRPGTLVTRLTKDGLYQELEPKEDCGDLMIVEYEEEEKQHRFKPYDKVLARDHDDEKWHCTFFSHYNDDCSRFPFYCIIGYYKKCIPYEGNENLVGTDKNPE